MSSKQMNLLFQQVIICISLGVLSGCSIFSSDSKNFHFNATVNGEKWKGDPWVLLQKNDVLHISGLKGYNSESISVEMAEFNGEGIYNTYNNRYSVFVGGDAVVFNAHAPDTTGTASIHSYYRKTDADVIEGKFEFEVVANKDYSDFKSGETITIKGTFRAEIDSLNPYLNYNYK